MSFDLNKLSDEELRSIASGDLKSLPEETLRLISGAQPPKGAVAPSPIVSGAETAEKFQTEADAKRAAIVQGFEESSKKDATTNPMTAEGVLTSTPALVTGAALLGALTTYVAPKVYKSVKERFMTKAPEAPVRIEPIGFESFADMTPTTTLDANPLGQSNMTLEDIERLRAAQQKATDTSPAPGPIARTPLPTGAVNPALFSSSPKAPVPAIEPPISTPIDSAPIDAPAPTPTSGPGSPVTTIVNDTVKDMMQQEPSKGMYRDASGNMVYPSEMSPAARAGAEAFAQQYPQHAAALEAEKRFGILGAGSADNNLFNAYGPELRKQILNEVNQGQLAGVYENYPERINPAIKALPPESPIAKQLEALRANDPKGANRGPLGTSAVVTPDVVTPRSKANTALKNAGRAALLVAMADAANAANKGDYVGAAKIAGPALDPTGMLEAAINPQNTARNLTSVSPTFGFLSQLIASRADERAKKAYAEKVGAGRGIAPPSAYQR